MKILILIRGLPGSGKSTIAKTIVAAHPPDRVTAVETDQYFINDNGTYVFDPSRLDKAHKWCQLKANMVMATSVPVVVVSNTFTTRWEMEPYLLSAEAHGYKVQIVECKADFGSIHNVPFQSIHRMKGRWEDAPPSGF